MQIKNGLSIIEALVVLSISILLGLIAVPIMAKRLGVGLPAGEAEEKSSVSQSSSETTVKLKEAPSIILPKPQPPVLPLLKNKDGAGTGGDGASANTPESPLSKVPTEKP
jgi:hypothetical protein